MENSEKNYKLLFDSINGTKLDFMYENIIKTNEDLSAFIKDNNIKETYETDLAIFSLFFRQTLKEKNDYLIQSLYEKILSDRIYINGISIDVNNTFHMNELTIDTKNGKISLIPLSSAIPSLKEKFPELDTLDRANKCFSGSRKLSLAISDNNDLVTGIVYGYTDKSEYLHSWVEVNLFDKEYVIDYTMNAIINKDGYYNFRHAKEIQRINNKDMINDMDEYQEELNTIYAHSAFYNVFRDEIINDLGKKKISK